MKTNLSENSLGMLFIGFTIATWLFGVNTMQAYVYFRKYNEGCIFKAVIVIVVVADMLNTILTGWGIYMELVPAPLVPLHGNVPLVLESTASDVAVFIVQCLFARSIYQVSRRKYLTGLIFVLATLGFASGMALTAASVTSLYYPGRALPLLNNVLVALALGLVTLTDVIITVSLVFNLFGCKTSIKQTSHLLDRLILYCVQRGILTTVSHAIVLVLWFCLHSKWAWTLVQFSLGKVYTLTFLLLLNRRESLRSSDHPYDHFSIQFEAAPIKVSTTPMCCDDGSNGSIMRSDTGSLAI